MIAELKLPCGQFRREAQLLESSHLSIDFHKNAFSYRYHSYLFMEKYHIDMEMIEIQ